MVLGDILLQRGCVIMRRVCPNEFVSLIFILNMIGSGPGVTFSDDSVNSTRKVIMAIAYLFHTLIKTLMTA